jgi:hypothetical protein
MALVGLLTANNPRDDDVGSVRAAVRIADQTLLERQTRMLMAAGVDRVILYAGPAEPLAERWLAAVQQRLPALEVVRSGPDIVGRVHPDDQVMLIEEGVVLSAMVVRAVIAARAQDVHVLATWPAESPQGAEAVRLDRDSAFGSVLLTTGEATRAVARGLGDWDLTQTLVRTALGSGRAHRIDLDSLTEPDGSPVLWQPVSSQQALRNLTGRVVALADPPRADPVSAAVIQPLERALAGLVMEQSGPVLAVWVAALVLGLAGASAMLTGWSGGGLIALLVAASLDRVARLVADVRLDTSRWVGHAGDLSGQLAMSLPSLLAMGVSLQLGHGWPVLVGLSASAFLLLAGLVRPAEGQLSRIGRIGVWVAPATRGLLALCIMALLVGLLLSWPAAVAAVWALAAVGLLIALRLRPQQPRLI